MENNGEFSASMEIVDQSNLKPDELVEAIQNCITSTTQNFIEIGKLLTIAKGKVEHGEWRDWLAHNFKFTIRTADRFMQCAKRFPNWTPASNLTSSHMIELLPLKANDTEEFLNQKASEGKSVETMTKKILREEVKKWKQAKKNNQISEQINDNQEEFNMSAHDVENEICESDLKKLEKFLILSEELSDKYNFDNLMKAYTKNDAEKMKCYTEKFFKIAQTIQNAINS